MKIELNGGFYIAKSIIANAQRSLNLYPERNTEDAPFPFTSYLTPGLSFLSGPCCTGVLIYATLPTGSTDEFNPTGFTPEVDGIVITTDADGSTLAGLAGGSQDRRMVLANAGPGLLTLEHAGSSLGADDLFLPASGSLIVQVNGAVAFFYDDNAPAWRAIEPTTLNSCDVEADFGTLTVCQTATIGTDFVGDGLCLTVLASAAVDDNLSVGVDLAVGGYGNFGGTISSDGEINVGGEANITGAANIGGGLNSGGAALIGGPILIAASTVADLPTPTNSGQRLIVTNALSPTYRAAVVGGGAVKCWVEDTGPGPSWVTV